MQAIVKKWGNSAAVRLPASILEEAGLKLDQPVNIRHEPGRVIIEPVNRHDINQLVAGITPENRHDLMDFGAPVGREAW